MEDNVAQFNSQRWCGKGVRDQIVEDKLESCTDKEVQGWTANIWLF